MTDPGHTPEPAPRTAPRPQPGLLLRLHLSDETGVLAARQRAKQIATLLGFDVQAQTRIATAVSEIARNAYEYAAGGIADFYLDDTPAHRLRIVIADQGRGIKPLQAILAGQYKSTSGMGLGIVGAKRLMDHVDIQSQPGGTTVTLIKHLPARAALPLPPINVLTAQLAEVSPHASTATREQNRDLLALLSELRAREIELHRLNQELEETNRGVLVLYAELEDKAQAVQQASEMKTRFLSGVTHELRTPLNSIVSLSRLLLARIDGDLNPEQEKQVQFIQRSAHNLTEMVNDLLDLAKVEAGKVSVNLSEFTVADTLAGLRGMFRPLAINENVALIFDNPDTPGQPALRLRTDEGKVAQILRNLIANALKFTESGTVTVTARAADDSILFSVADTGIGIAPEDFSLVLQEWGQVESASHNKQKGSGLGLPLSMRFAELLGGRIWFESTVGRGSTFFLSLPALLNTHATPSPGPAAHLPYILIADADEVARYLLARRLESLTTAPISVVASAEACVEAVTSRRPALVFVDLVNPAVGGFELARRLRSNPENREIPIILHTAQTLSADDFATLTTLNLDFIPKREDDRQSQHSRDRNMQFERALLQVGLSNMHQSGEQ